MPAITGLPPRTGDWAGLPALAPAPAPALQIGGVSQQMGVPTLALPGKEENPSVAGSWP